MDMSQHTSSQQSPQVVVNDGSVSSSGKEGTSAVADALKSMTKSEMYDVISQLKEVADRDADEARKLLCGHPQLPEAILHLMSKLDMIQTPLNEITSPTQHLMIPGTGPLPVPNNLPPLMTQPPPANTSLPPPDPRSVPSDPRAVLSDPRKAVFGAATSADPRLAAVSDPRSQMNPPANTNLPPPTHLPPPFIIHRLLCINLHPNTLCLLLQLILTLIRLLY